MFEEDSWLRVYKVYPVKASLPIGYYATVMREANVVHGHVAIPCMWPPHQGISAKKCIHLNHNKINYNNIHIKRSIDAVGMQEPYARVSHISYILVERVFVAHGSRFQ